MRVLGMVSALALSVAASLGVLALGLYQLAAPAPWASPAPPPLLRMQTVIRAVNLNSGELLVGDPGHPQILHVGPDATVFAQGRMTRLGALRVGQSVCAAYESHRALEVLWIEPCALPTDSARAPGR